MAAPAPLVVVPYDFSPAAKAALEQAVELAPKFGARLELVHVVDESTDYIVPIDVPPVPSLYLRELAERLGVYLEGSAGPAREAGLSCETRVLRGLAAPEILDRLEATRPMMVVMGTRGRAGWRRALLGSVAERVVRRARCPVLVVPDPARD